MSQLSSPRGQTVFHFALFGIVFFFETKFLCVALELVTFPPVPPKMCMTGLNTLFLTY